MIRWFARNDIAANFLLVGVLLWEAWSLVEKVPQLKEATANVTAAMADLDQARRNLERAKIRAPFDGRVKSREVGLGQAVGGTTPLGEIFATDYAEVRLPLSASQIAFAKLPTRENDAPVKVTLIDALGSDSAPNTWAAKIVRTVGTLDAASRELFTSARIDDPFGLELGNPELRIGQPVRAEVDGVVLDDVIVLPRTALRGVNRVYPIDREAMTIARTDVNPIWSTSEELVVRDGLKQVDWMATSRMPYAPNGAEVNVIEEIEAAEAQDSEGTTTKLSGS